MLAHLDRSVEAIHIDVDDAAKSAHGEEFDRCYVLESSDWLRQDEGPHDHGVKAGACLLPMLGMQLTGLHQISTFPARPAPALCGLPQRPVRQPSGPATDRHKSGCRPHSAASGRVQSTSPLYLSSFSEALMVSSAGRLNSSLNIPQLIPTSLPVQVQVD